MTSQQVAELPCPGNVMTRDPEMHRQHPEIDSYPHGTVCQCLGTGRRYPSLWTPKGHYDGGGRWQDDGLVLDATLAKGLEILLTQFGDVGIIKAEADHPYTHEHHVSYWIRGQEGDTLEEAVFAAILATMEKGNAHTS